MSNFIDNETYEKEEMGEKQEAEKIVSMEEKKAKRPQFVKWEVGNAVYNLKLTVTAQMELEKKFRKNLLSLLGDEDNLPPLTTILQVIHAAAEPWQHGLKLRDIQSAYEKYLEKGGSMLELYANVYIPIFTVSGFFSSSMAEEMEYTMESVQKNL